MDEAAQRTATGPAVAAAGTAKAPACTLVIFGAGGDLTKRLLMPALYNLSGSALLPDEFRVIGVDRAGDGDDAWKASLTGTMHSFTKDKTAEFYTPTLDEHAWGWVTSRMHGSVANCWFGRTSGGDWVRGPVRLP